jgi:hypothetical protein
MTAPCPYEDCDATFTGEQANIAVVNHVSAVHIHGGEASEPAPRQDDVIETTAKAIFEAQVFRPSWGARPSWDSEAVNQDSFRVAALALRDLGLLADPAQTTELEKLAADHLALLGQRDAWWEHVGRERRQLESERDERQARIDRVLGILDEPAPVPPQTDPHFERMNARNTRTQLVERVRAALAGDQPTLGIAGPGPGCYPPVDGWDGESIAERAATPPDLSGRIVDGGPVQPFTDADCADMTPTAEDVISGD